VGFDVIAIGSAVVDAFARTDAETISIKGINHGHNVDEKLIAYPVGTKILIKQLDFHIGGGGTNVCATFTRLGLRTAFVGKIGKDSNGHLIFDWLKQNKITFLGQVGGQTGYSVVLDSQADDRTILTYKGANDELDFSKLPRRELKAKWLYGSSMMNRSWEAEQKLFLFAKNNGIKTAFNPSSYMVEKGIGFLKDILKSTTALILNKEEAEALVGNGDSSELVKRLLSHGPSIVAVTDGKNGVVIGNADERFRILPAKNLKIVETTGAGDAFGAGLVAGLVLGKPLREATLMGVLNAEGVIQAYGAKERIANRAEMESLLRAETKRSRHEIDRM